MRRTGRTGRPIHDDPARSSRVRRAPAVVAVALLAFMAGAAADRAVREAHAKSHDPVYKALDRLTETYDLVRREYVEPIDGARLVRGALEGMVRGLDPHSAWLDADGVRAFHEDAEGRFAGVGMALGQRGCALTVLEVLPDTPAAGASVRVGDRVRAVDGQDAQRLTSTEVIERIRGPVDTTVTLTLEGEDGRRDLTLTRARVSVDPVDARRLPGDVALVRIRAFQTGTASRVSEALRRLAQAAPLQGLLLDLRDNPGGLLRQGVAVADLFVEDGLIVRTAGRDPGRTRAYNGHAGAVLPKLPMLVLINRGSASASEIVAGALQDRGRARLIGARSYGKGSVQVLFPLTGGAGVKLTVARYTTPSGRSIDGVGLTPDLPVDGADETPPATGPDIVIERALAALIPPPERP